MESKFNLHIRTRLGLAALMALLPLHAARATSEAVATAEQSSTGLESGAMTPLSICTTKYPNYVVPQYLPVSGLNYSSLNGNFCQKHFWNAASFNENDRLTKGAEACGFPPSYKDGWLGFLFYLPSAPAFTTTGESAIAQIFQSGYCNSWASLISVKANNLVIYHRSFCGDPTLVTLATNLPRNTWIPVLVNYRVSNQGAGHIKVWLNDAPETTPTYNYTGNFGFAQGWNSDDTLPAGSSIGCKIGLYTTPEAGEVSKTIYYDNICALNTNPPGAFDRVDPLNADNLPQPFAAASNSASNEGPVNAFDASTDTKWYCPTTTGAGWLLRNFGGESRIVTRYDVSSAYDAQARDPKNWSFQGSQDGTNWTTIETRTNQAFATRKLTKQYPITNTTAYKFYRLNITANNGDPVSVQLSELAFAYAPSLPPANGTYRVIASHSGKAMDVPGGSAATQDNLPIQQYTYHGGSNQKWQVTALGGGYYKVIAVHSGKALTIPGSSPNNDVQAVQLPYTGAYNQQWKIEVVGFNYRLIARHSSKALDVAGRSIENEAPIIQYNPTNAANQQWQLSLP